MKKFILVVLAIAALASCTKELEQTPAGGITGTVVPFAYDDATRTNLVYNQTGLDFTWSSKDRVAVFGPGGEQQLMMKINVKEGEAVRTATFTITTAYSLKKGSDYVAYCPLVNDMELKASAVNFSYPAEQEQTGNGRECTGHIGQYDFMVSGLTPATADNKAAFSFVHKCCPVLVEITDVPAGTYGSVALKAPGSIFTTEGTYDVFNDVPTSTATVDKVTVSFKEPVTLTAKGTLSVWMMMAPASAGGMKLEVEVTGTDGKVCSGQVNGRNMIAGSAYLYTTKAETGIGRLPGEFTINAKGDKVHFSQGNLQYQASTQIWRFAEHQYDFVGDATRGTVYSGGVKCDNSNISSSYSGWIDLLGFGTSGFNTSVSGASTRKATECWQPWSTDTGYEKYWINGQYRNSDKTPLLLSTELRTDWGANKIFVQYGDTMKESDLKWRTLSIDEWVYVIESRPGNRYCVCNLTLTSGGTALISDYCIFLFPDNWDASKSPVQFAYNNSNTSGAMGYSLILTADQLETLQKAGVVLLPNPGYRDGTTVTFLQALDSKNGIQYWSATSPKYSAAGSPDCNVISIFKQAATNYLKMGRPTSHWYHPERGGAVRLVTDEK